MAGMTFNSTFYKLSLYLIAIWSYFFADPVVTHSIPLRNPLSSRGLYIHLFTRDSRLTARAGRSKNGRVFMTRVITIV